MSASALHCEDLRAVQASAIHDAFLAAACAGFVALVVAGVLMPRGKASTSSEQGSESSETVRAT